MIIDTLDNLEKYVSLHPLFADVVEFLKNNNINSLQEGKHIIKGEDLFLNISVAKGRKAEDAVMETHVKMIDIQIPISCSETYGYSPAITLPEAKYDEVKDITKIEDIQADCYITCRVGMFAIFFPQDGHAPGISDEIGIKKAIFKVRV